MTRAKKQKEKQEDYKSEIEEIRRELKETQKTMKELFDFVKEEVIRKKEEKIEEKKEEEKQPEEKTEQFIPPEWIDVVHSVLNKKFGVKVEYFKDRPEFLFTIVVPDEYSNMPLKEKEVKKVDLRSKVIPIAEGVNGVRQWAEQVYNNFSPEIRAKIKSDAINNI